jgi:hypothetical protein
MRKCDRHIINATALFLLAANFVNGQQQNTYEVLSPDQTIKLAVTVTENIAYSVTVYKQTIIVPSTISMTLENDGVLG